MHVRLPNQKPEGGFALTDGRVVKRPELPEDVIKPLAGLVQAVEGRPVGALVGLSARELHKVVDSLQPASRRLSEECMPHSAPLPKPHSHQFNLFIHKVADSYSIWLAACFKSKDGGQHHHIHAPCTPFSKGATGEGPKRAIYQSPTCPVLGVQAC
jgi:hypothetical protein